MAWADLGEFLTALEERGELHRIAAEVDPVLELAEITDRVGKQPHGGSGLFFEKVTGSRFPAVANVFGSARRMALALGVECLDDLSPLMARILEGWEPIPATSLEDVPDPPCREVVERFPDLLTLPLLRGWPDDGSAARGRYLTLPLVITADIESGELNCGLYRVEVLGPDRAVIGWHADSDGERQYRDYLASGRRMPVAIALGGPPALLLAASFSLPDLPDEFTFGGMLQNEPIAVVRCLTSDLTVPASAEVIIEGYLEPGETAREGPFGNHTGCYAPARQAPLFRVTAMTRRLNPVIPVTVVGPPPQEDCWLAKAAERLMLPWLQRRFPEVVDLCFPLETIFHRAVIVSVDTSRNGDIPALLRRLREEGPLRRAKVIVVVDADTGTDPSSVWWRALNCCNWQRDLLVSDDGAFLGIDATLKAEQVPPLERRETADLVTRRWREYGLIWHEDL
jgi:4-hydroxy-3-polyprenylbenzoate decarboxylase